MHRFQEMSLYVRCTSVQNKKKKKSKVRRVRSVGSLGSLAFVLCLCTSAGLKHALGASICFSAKCVFSPEPLSELQIFVQYFRSLFLVLKGVLSCSVSSQRRCLWNRVCSFVLLSHTPPEQVPHQHSSREDADEDTFLQHETYSVKCASNLHCIITDHKVPPKI